MRSDPVAVAALRGLLAQAEADPGLAAELLARLRLGVEVQADDPEPAPPERTRAEEPTPTRRKRRPKRRARAEAQDGSDEAAEEGDEDDESARGCVRTLVTSAGSVEAAAKFYGFKPENLRRWLRGGTCSPSSLRRLHAALLSPPSAKVDDDEDDDAGEAEDGTAPGVAGATATPFRG